MEDIEYLDDVVPGNITIAKFMGWKIDNSFPDKGRVWRLNKIIELDTTFKFHSSWDQLMPVIYELNYRDNKNFFGVYHWFECHAVGGLEDAWYKVVNEIQEKYER
jgi:hypothetical protein